MASIVRVFINENVSRKSDAEIYNASIDVSRGYEPTLSFRPHSGISGLLPMQVIGGRNLEIMVIRIVKQLEESKVSVFFQDNGKDILNVSKRGIWNI